MIHLLIILSLLILQLLVFHLLFRKSVPRVKNDILLALTLCDFVAIPRNYFARIDPIQSHFLSYSQVKENGRPNKHLEQCVQKYLAKFRKSSTRMCDHEADQNCVQGHCELHRRRLL